jgi:hypothetical protein
VERFGEAPGILWWVPGLPKISIFLVMVSSFAGNHHQKWVILGGLAALQTSPQSADCVSPASIIVIVTLIILHDRLIVNMLVVARNMQRGEKRCLTSTGRAAILKVLS